MQGFIKPEVGDVPFNKKPPIAVVVGGLRFPTEKAYKDYLARTTGRNAIIQHLRAGEIRKENS